MRSDWIADAAASKVSAPVADNAARGNCEGFHEDASIFGLRAARDLAATAVATVTPYPANVPLPVPAPAV